MAKKKRKSAKGKAKGKKRGRPAEDESDYETPPMKYFKVSGFDGWDLSYDAFELAVPKDDDLEQALLPLCEGGYGWSKMPASLSLEQSRYEADLDRLTSIKDLVMATGEDNGDAKTNKHEHSEREEAAHKLEAQEVDNVEPADMFGPLLFLPEVLPDFVPESLRGDTPTPPTTA